MPTRADPGLFKCVTGSTQSPVREFESPRDFSTPYASVREQRMPSAFFHRVSRRTQVPVLSNHPDFNTLDVDAIRFFQRNRRLVPVLSNHPDFNTLHSTRSGSFSLTVD
jgi:hypothetical protein